MTEGEQSAPPEQPFDPYRYGKPDHPIPQEYWPPGYVPDEPVQAQPVGPNQLYGPSPYASIPSPYQPPPGYPPYSPYPQYPQYPGYGQPPAGPKTNSKAVTSLSLGAASILLSFLGFLDLVPIILALVFGFQALRLVRAGRSDARGLAIAGIACAFVGAVAALIFTIHAVQAINKCGGIDNRNSPGFYTCVQNHL